MDISFLSDSYIENCRPGMGSLLKSLKLDYVYHRAKGDRLYTNVDGNEVEVIDFVNGYGAGFFGHLYQPFVDLKIELLTSGVPYLAQGSVRKYPALLANSISDQLKLITGNRYVSLIHNTGSDAVDCALKYSEYHRRSRLKKIKKFVDKQVLSFNKGPIDQYSLCPLASERYGEDPLLAIDNYLSELQNIFSEPGSNISIRQAYHGKLTGPLQLTYNKALRSEFDSLGSNTLFVDDDPESLDRAVEISTLQIPILTVRNKIVSLTYEPFVNISALFVEPIRGEGGIRPIDADFMLHASKVSSNSQFLFVVDEIQTGLGRTGHFIASEKYGVFGDIFLFSKTLGGGLSKISAVSIRESIYDPSFDEIHSSTFSEDEYSAAIALQVVSSLTSDPAIFDLCRRKSTYFSFCLNEIKSKYPNIVKDVRSEGLMLGFEFSNFNNIDSQVIRDLSRNELITKAVAGYLLHQHSIRVGISLSDPFTLRIQPSVFISEEDIDYFVESLAAACDILSRADSASLLSHLVVEKGQSFHVSQSTYDVSETRFEAPLENSSTVSFIATPAIDRYLPELDSSFQKYSDSDLKRFDEFLHDNSESFDIQSTKIIAKDGSTVNFKLVGIPYTPTEVKSAFTDQPKLKNIVSVIDQNMRHSEFCGDHAYGLGSFTSIVTNNGLSLKSDKISITSGNSLTVGIGVQALFKAAKSRDLDIDTSNLVVIGAAGNIGSIYSEIMADYVKTITLVGSKGSLKKLDSLRSRIYESQLNRSHEGLSNIFERNGSFDDLRSSITSDLSQPIGEYVSDYFDRVGGHPIQIDDVFDGLSQDSFIVTCTNSDHYIVKPDHVDGYKAVICDISVPEDVHPYVRSMKDAVVIQGGLVKLPNNPDTTFSGIPALPKGHAYACMVETMILGLEGISGHYSYGKITREKVDHMLNLAEKYGFEIGDVKTDSVF